MCDPAHTLSTSRWPSQAWEQSFVLFSQHLSGVYSMPSTALPLWAKPLQLCSTLYDPIDCSPPGFSVPGILQARIMKWAAVPSSRGPYRPRNWTCVSCIGRLIFFFFFFFFTTSASWEVPSTALQLCKYQFIECSQPYGLRIFIITILHMGNGGTERLVSGPSHTVSK